ncbi:MAG: ABC transporter permease [Lachnospiraceae bacterium]|nr:ABC transporter permease [Lachnospiraceae bacterium]
MNIVSRLTLKHLLSNRKRSVVTILGIAASTALISAILLGVFSFFRFFGYITIQASGDVHAEFREVSKEQFLSLKEDPSIACAGLCEQEETRTGVRLGSNKEERFRVGNIDHGDKEYLSMKIVSEYDGRLPENSSEIAVEEKFLKENGLENLKPGDTLTFEEGYRYIDDSLEGFTYLGGNYRSDEKFCALSGETCTVTAILHGNRASKDWDILRGLDEGYYPQKDKALVFIRVKRADHTAIRQIKEIASSHGIEKYGWNTEYMLSLFAFEESAGAYRSFFVLMAVALIIVIITSVVLIFNSIEMSLTERLRYLGMLSSVGATARQKRFSIYYEAMILGMIGIPVGLLMGYIGTKITLVFLGRRILAANILAGAEGMSGSIPIECSPVVLLMIVLFGILTVLFAAFVPAIKAARIMPVDAIRQTDTIKVRAKRLRVNPLIRKLFGYEGELAYKNIKRNGTKGTVITTSIAISVILFLTINFFCNSVSRANRYEIEIPYQIVASCSLSESDKLRQAISEMDGVDSVYSACTIQYLFRQRPDGHNELANGDIADPAFRTPAFRDADISTMSLLIVDDAWFDRILASNGLSKEKYYGDTLKGVLLNDYFREKKPSEVFNGMILGQALHYDQEKGNPPSVEVADFVKYDMEEKSYGLSLKESVAVFVPMSMYYEKAKEVLPEEKLTTDLGVETSRHTEVHDRIMELFQAEGYHHYSCSDLADSIQVMDTITLTLKTAMYGFTVLLTLIAVANIINTISTGVLLRRKEFAMYKSVGLENGGFRKMIRLETLLYGVRALVLGLPVSLLLSYLMYSAFDSELFTFDPDPVMYGAVIMAVFAILGISMLLSVNRIRDDNIIEALKEDAI